jgi:excisionase family DNA binding protein
MPNRDDTEDAMGIKRILRTSEAAEYLGLSPSTLEKRRQTGLGPPFIRLGGRAVGYARDDLDAWIDKHRFHMDSSDHESR